MKFRPAKIALGSKAPGRFRRPSLLLVLAGLASLAGCATSSQARGVKASGFLGDYRSLLLPGKPGEQEGIEASELTPTRNSLSS
jgi:hypothetical protein